MPRDVSKSLSPREDEIIRLAADGLTDTAIAHKLGISEGTVGTYWGRIRTKIGPYPRTELIAVRIHQEMDRRIAEEESRLKMMADELHSAEADDLLFHDIVNAAAEGILIVDEEGVILHANPAAYSILGHEAGALEGTCVCGMVPESVRETHVARFKAFCKSPSLGLRLPRLETSALNAAGQEIPISIAVSALKRGDSLLLVGFFQRADGPARCLKVEDLVRLGVTDAPALDLDGNGVIDENEVRLATAKRDSPR